MASKSTQPSQVGLFSTQISEQIGRLRALAQQDGGTDSVALKRAVMATRLLGGSARILHLDSLQDFLDELLDWLQRLEVSGHPPTPTQSMILGSVIAMEEELLRALERGEEEDAADLSAFDQDLGELLGLIRKNTESLESGGDEALTASDPATVAPDELPVLEALGELLSQLEGLGSAAGDAGLSPTLSAELGDVHDRLGEILGRAKARGAAASAPAGAPTRQAARAASPTRPPAARPAPPAQMPPPVVEMTTGQMDEAQMTDAIACFAHALLETEREELEGAFHYEVIGTIGELESTVADAINEVLQNLLEDVFAVFREMVKDERQGASGIPQIGLELERDAGCLKLRVRDNGPRMGDAPALDDADPLGVYRGLRHSRPLIEQLNGLVRVEPGDRPEYRFVLRLPVDFQKQSYRIVDLGTALVAVPWVLVDEVVSTEGLLFHADTDGEMFEHNGQPIPLLDLGQMASGNVAVGEMGEKIVILGSVEKRVGLYCEAVGDHVEADAIEGVPNGWEEVAYGGLKVKNGNLPLLDVPRLIQFRFGAGLGLDEAGSHRDPVMDVYVPSQATRPIQPLRDDSEPLEAPEMVEHVGAAPPQASASPVEDSESMHPIPAPLGGSDSGQRALLINQSDFRRKDLARSLESLGFSVTATEDLVGGLHYLESHKADLVVTDLRLGEKGNENLGHLRDGAPQLPVVLTSSVAREYADQLAEKTGADACWLEPYRAGDLEAILRALP